MKTKLIIVGASGHGKVVADIALRMNKWKDIVFLDDNTAIKTSLGLKILGRTTDAYAYRNESVFFIAIGDNKKREKIQTEFEKKGLEIATLIHPSSAISSDVKIGIGTTIMAGVVINPSTTIGKGCILNTSCSIDHDNVIEDFVHISPGTHLAGTVNVGKRTWIGIGCTISNNISICNDCIIGAGSLVIQSILESETYIGLPTRRIIVNKDINTN